MTGVLKSISVQHRRVIAEILGSANPALLADFTLQSVPTREQREQVEEILSKEFSRHLKSDFEPTARGVLIDDSLGEFLLTWPIETPG